MLIVDVLGNVKEGNKLLRCCQNCRTHGQKIDEGDYRMSLIFNSLGDLFQKGWQPCDNYKPAKDGNEYGSWDDIHECYQKGCNLTVSFCLTCNKDHHAGGYETCTCECHEYLRVKGP